MPRPKIKYNPAIAYIPIVFLIIDELVKGTGLVADKIRCFYHQLFMQRLNDSKSDKVIKTAKYKGGWVSLSSVLLMHLLTPEYKKYLDFLEENGLLIVRRNPDTGNLIYSRNGSNAQYKIPEKFLRKQGSIRHYRKEIITDHTTLKAIRKVKESFRMKAIGGKNLLLEPIHKKLIDMVNQVRFDIPNAENFLSKVASGEMKVRETKSGIDRNYSDILLRLEAINDGQFKICKVDKFGNRLHTSASNLWKELRPFMYFKGLEHKRLVVLDFANSQPYFSSIAINPKLIAEILPEFAVCVPLVEPLKQKPDFKRFAELCAKGKIYEHWQSIRKLKDRAVAKEEIFQLMFGTNKLWKGSPKSIFKQYFPSVYQCFATIKSHTEIQLPFIKDVFLTKTGIFDRKAYYKNLSCMMQRMESRIVLGRIAPKLLAEGIIPFVTVHDSFIILAEHEKKVREIINAEIELLEVTPPVIKTEILTFRNKNIQHQ